MGIADDALHRVIRRPDEAHHEIAGLQQGQQDQFERIDTICHHNTAKVLAAYKEAQISSYQFAGTSGYGYSDMGREKLDEVFARVFKAEKAIVRPHFVSGTHALATVLLALLQTGDDVGTGFNRFFFSSKFADRKSTRLG